MKPEILTYYQVRSLPFYKLIRERERLGSQWRALDNRIENMRRTPDVSSIHDVEALALQRESCMRLLEAIDIEIKSHNPNPTPYE